MALRPRLSCDRDVVLHSGSVIDPGDVRGIEGIEGIADGTDFSHNPRVVGALSSPGLHETQVVFKRGVLHFLPPVSESVMHPVADEVLAIRDRNRYMF